MATLLVLFAQTCLSWRRRQTAAPLASGCAFPLHPHAASYLPLLPPEAYMPSTSAHLFPLKLEGGIPLLISRLHACSSSVSPGGFLMGDCWHWEERDSPVMPPAGLPPHFPVRCRRGGFSAALQTGLNSPQRHRGFLLYWRLIWWEGRSTSSISAMDSSSSARPCLLKLHSYHSP